MRLILLVGDVLHPLNGLAGQRFLDRDVSHRSRRRRPMPMLLTWREPDNVPRTNLFNRTTPALRQPEPSRDNQSLAKRMRMPRRSSSRFERNARADSARRLRCLKQGIDPNSSSEPIRRTFIGWLRTATFDFHQKLNHDEPRQKELPVNFLREKFRHQILIVGKDFFLIGTLPAFRIQIVLIELSHPLEHFLVLSVH
jgi:hypothetical protein